MTYVKRKLAHYDDTPEQGARLVVTGWRSKNPAYHWYTPWRPRYSPEMAVFSASYPSGELRAVT